MKGSSKGRILVVDDERSMREMLEIFLGREGYDVMGHSAANDALLVLEEDKGFDLIITDINMPDINGLELINFVKNNINYRDIPLIVVTTEGAERDRQKGLALGADEYLVKPIDPEVLQEAVARNLEKCGR